MFNIFLGLILKGTLDQSKFVLRDNACYGIALSFIWYQNTVRMFEIVLKIYIYMKLSVIPPAKDLIQRSHRKLRCHFKLNAFLRRCQPWTGSTIATLTTATPSTRLCERCARETLSGELTSLKTGKALQVPERKGYSSSDDAEAHVLLYFLYKFCIFAAYQVQMLKKVFH